MSDPSAVTVATDPATLRKIADEAFTAFNSGGRHVQSFSARYPGFTLDDAYRVTALANELRVANGYKPVGRKAGFTNRQMWKEYGVSAPNWGYVYDRTLHDLAVPLPLAPYTEPKIEPEIMFGLATAPSPGMDNAALLCHEIGTGADEWLRTLRQFEVELYCDGKLMERGYGSNVLEGPLSAVRYLVELLARDPDNPPLAAGEIISTGTLTRALPVNPGEMWTTKLRGIDLEGASLRLA
ncbi:MAG: hydratase [Pseudolabrys sp.]